MVKKQEPENKFRWGFAAAVVIGLMFLGFIISGFLGISSDEIESGRGNVALIKINRVIVGDDEGGFLSGNTASSSDIVKLIEKAGSNPNIKAIILEINSPGGSAVASSEIADAVKKTNKTTVAWIREIGTSGAYWVASSADYVVANKASITGSIGVIASYLEFDGLLDRYNVTYRRLVSGKYKDLGSPFKEMTEEEEKIFQKNLDSIRDFFVDEVAKNRKLRKSDVDRIATGVFYLGGEAKSLGLIDELGGKQEAIAYIEKKEGIKAEITEYKKEKTLLDILSKVMSKQSFNVGKGIGSAFLDARITNKISITS